MNAFTGDALLSGGAQEVERLDSGWETYQSVMQQAVTSGGDIDDDFNEVRRPLMPDDVVEFTLDLPLKDASASDATLKVVVPEGCMGGFTIMSIATSALTTTQNYGPDQFNTFVGSLRGGPGGILDSYDVHFISGNLRNGDNPGLLKFQLSGTGFTVPPGCMLRVRERGS